MCVVEKSLFVANHFDWLSVYRDGRYLTASIQLNEIKSK